MAGRLLPCRPEPLHVLRWQEPTQLGAQPEPARGVQAGRCHGPRLLVIDAYVMRWGSPDDLGYVHIVAPQQRLDGLDVGSSPDRKHSESGIEVGDYRQIGDGVAVTNFEDLP